MGSTKRYLSASQLALTGLLLLCSFMAPSVVSTDGGVSNFGNRLSTVVPYTLGFSLSAAFLIVAAIDLLSQRVVSKIYAATLLVVAALDLLVLVSTYPRHINLIYSEVHDDLGIALFVFEFALSLWCLVRGWNQSTTALFSVELVGSIIGLLSILKLVHLLYYGQVVGGLGFGLLLITTFPRLIVTDTPRG
jgi:hypothetical protein